MKKQTKYEEKYLKTNRTFPVGNTIFLILILAAQIALIFVGITYRPEPRDLIHEYNVTVEPLDDGSLDITYELVWQALDPTEPLTWVEIGMANEDFTIYANSLSTNIKECEKYSEDDYVSARVLFKEAYKGGEMVSFRFKVNQKNMLCWDKNGYFYEFVPGWFNDIQVKQYTFTWRMEDGEDMVKQGRLDYGQYDMLFVRYDEDAFTGCHTVRYHPFDDNGAYNGMKENKEGTMAVCFLVAAVLIILEVYIVDCYVSYGRGRGFLTGYGYHVHTYGRSNPYYVRARNRHRATTGSGGRSGGCACACACACAGGGRAGCSQKDTYGSRRTDTEGE